MIATNPFNDRAKALSELRGLVAEKSKEWINTLVEYSQRSGLFTVKLADDLDTSLFVGALVDSLDRQGYDVAITGVAVIGNDPAAGCLVLLVSCLVRRKAGEEIARVLL